MEERGILNLGFIYFEIRDICLYVWINFIVEVKSCLKIIIWIGSLNGYKFRCKFVCEDMFLSYFNKDRLNN